MSKYDPLWVYLEDKGEEDYKLTFCKIEKILGFKIDHSFLTYKKIRKLRLRRRENFDERQNRGIYKTIELSAIFSITQPLLW